MRHKFLSPLVALVAGVTLAWVLFPRAAASAQVTPLIAGYTDVRPDPRSLIIIRESDGPYTVPVGGRLIIYAVGGTEGSGNYMDIRIDGWPLRFSRAGGEGELSLNVRPVPEFPLDAGSVLTIDDRVVSDGTEFHGGVVFGYLVRA